MIFSDCNTLLLYCLISITCALPSPSNHDVTSYGASNASVETDPMFASLVEAGMDHIRRTSTRRFELWTIFVTTTEIPSIDPYDFTKMSITVQHSIVKDLLTTNNFDGGRWSTVDKTARPPPGFTPLQPWNWKDRTLSLQIAFLKAQYFASPFESIWVRQSKTSPSEPVEPEYEFKALHPRKTVIVGAVSGRVRVAPFDAPDQNSSVKIS